jgi:hypothetical protein
MAEDLRAEYEKVAKAIDDLELSTPAGTGLVAVIVACRHILKRLGPPEPLDGIEADALSVGSDEPPGTLSYLMLDFGRARAPRSVEKAARMALSLRDFTNSPRFNDYLKRQNKRQEEFYKAGGDMTEFRAEEWS